MSYTTQKNAAKKGILTEAMRNVLCEEKIQTEDLMERLSKGQIAIPANKNHIHLKAKGVGKGLSTKVNVNLGVSEDNYDLEMELKKVKMAIEGKADAIMDLSTFGNTEKFRKELVWLSPVMIGTVPIYDTVVRYGKAVKDITVDEWFKTVEVHAENGIDFLTIHAGLNRVAVERIQNNPRLTNIVSRGGSILYEWMMRNDKENPFYEHYDRLLEICQKHDVTISLGDGLRPGSLKDATDAPQIQELIILGELTKRAWEQDVQVMIEGPGHVPYQDIKTNMEIQKKLCHGAPFYVLGPLPTDVAPGYDHIVGAIGGALAGCSGADFLCYLTPAEHLRLPDENDVKEGLMVTRIAAHISDIAKGIPGAIDWDHKMSEARSNLNWEEMYKLSIDPKKSREYRESAMPNDEELCSMCGDFCAIKRSNDVNKDHGKKEKKA